MSVSLNIIGFYGNHKRNHRGIHNSTNILVTPNELYNTYSSFLTDLPEKTGLASLKKVEISYYVSPNQSSTPPRKFSTTYTSNLSHTKQAEESLANCLLSVTLQLNDDIDEVNKQDKENVMQRCN